MQKPRGSCFKGKNLVRTVINILTGGLNLRRARGKVVTKRDLKFHLLSSLLFVKSGVWMKLSFLIIAIRFPSMLIYYKILKTFWGAGMVQW